MAPRSLLSQGGRVGLTGSSDTRLVVIHGNSASGKTTLARAIRDGAMLAQLAAEHRGITRCYRYELTFDETARRQASVDRVRTRDHAWVVARR